MKQNEDRDPIFNPAPNNDPDTVEPSVYHHPVFEKVNVVLGED